MTIQEILNHECLKIENKQEPKEPENKVVTQIENK